MPRRMRGGAFLNGTARVAPGGAMPDRCGSCPNRPIPMPAQTDAERELAELLVESLNLDGVAADGIDPEAPLFNAGLGLDSIDALELALAISKRYGFQLRSDSDENRRIFASLRALSEHVQQHRTT
jgi:acyl carrier protein